MTRTGVSGTHYSLERNKNRFLGFIQTGVKMLGLSASKYIYIYIYISLCWITLINILFHKEFTPQVQNSTMKIVKAIPITTTEPINYAGEYMLSITSASIALWSHWNTANQEKFLWYICLHINIVKYDAICLLYTSDAADE